MFGLSELAIILIVVIAVLAAKKLPELARSAGKSARILKSEARALKEEQGAAAAPPPPAEEAPREPAPDGPASPRVIQGEVVDRDERRPGTEPSRD
ncbi:twin-arginine translocase TatA/TatE family subunit [Streptomyces tagetis]|uniref:Sec-independent protein translocase protein TatA n=1 Tax=Streptomyces tagetis TaxID=2820809 RepID=A0A940XMZ6_9ACTN|nr:twin-arginine translocase TatA/TatE family subunit [Streptomyces sp. RG38]MBQ0827549.1 twin-arginine translocase TatA/TatE family subunit [Streptomyces sp. RG38]